MTGKLVSRVARHGSCNLGDKASSMVPPFVADPFCDADRPAKVPLVAALIQLVQHLSRVTQYGWIGRGGDALVGFLQRLLESIRATAGGSQCSRRSVHFSFDLRDSA